MLPQKLPITRNVVLRTKGQRYGSITRLMSPGDIGEMIKPFVFLDYFELIPDPEFGFRPHAHSGIATHTTFLDGGMGYGDSTGKSGSLSAGSVEWMQAGGGVWHWGKPSPGVACRGYQLWLALPPELELAPAKSQFIKSSLIGNDGAVRILLGRYLDLRSPVLADLPITYLHVRLHPGDRWTYTPHTSHQVAWLAINEGQLHVSEVTLEHELSVFEEGNSSIEMRTESGAEFVIGSAVKHPYPLVCGPSSVHTTREALCRALANLEESASIPEVVAAQSGMRQESDT